MMMPTIDTRADDCPICGEGALDCVTYTRSIEVGGSVFNVDGFLKRVCRSCGGIVAGPDESRHNKRLITAFNKQQSGLLSGEEIADIRKGYLLSQRDASLIFGGGPVAFSKYENDEVTQSTSMDNLLRIVRDHPHILADLAKAAGVVLKPSRKFGMPHGRRKTDGDKMTVAMRFPEGFTVVEGLPVFGVYHRGQVIITEEYTEDATESAAA